MFRIDGPCPVCEPPPPDYPLLMPPRCDVHQLVESAPVDLNKSCPGCVPPRPGDSPVRTAPPCPDCRAELQAIFDEDQR